MNLNSFRTSLLLPLSLGLLALTACNAPPPDEQEEVATQAHLAAQAAATPAPEVSPVAPPPGECDASQVNGLIGQKADETTLEQAKEDSKATTVRTLTPGQMTTLEFDGQRLNVEVDDNNIITSLRCG